MQNMLSISATRPHKKTELAMYSDMFYESKLKASCDAEWRTSLRSGVRSKDRISFIKTFLQERYKNEPDDVKTEVRLRCETVYEEAMKSWNERADWSATAEGFDA